MCSIHKEVGAAMSTTVFLLLVPSCLSHTDNLVLWHSMNSIFDMVQFAIFSRHIYVIDKMLKIITLQFDILNIYAYMWITYIWTTHISTASKGHELPQMSTLDYSKVKSYHRQSHSLHFVGLGYAFSMLNMHSMCWKAFSAGIHWDGMSFLVVNSEYNNINTPWRVPGLGENFVTFCL
jgi:hypothetical protein